MDNFDDVSGDACARFSDEARRAIYDVIAMRRDVRHFREDVDVDDDTLMRVLGAAHLAPSVGFSQPWGFVIVRDRAARARVRDSFLRCRAAESVRFPVGRRSQYLSFRLEGILQAPLNLCVTVDLRSRGEAVLGTTAQPEAVRASVCCAVQNLWLAARAEGLGVGWVSIVEPAVLRAALELPAGVEPIAYLCVGVPVAFRRRPMLEETGWLGRRPLEDLVHHERWSDHPDDNSRDPGRDQDHDRVVDHVRDRVHAHDRPVFDEGARAAALRYQQELTKPRGSLGRLEDVAAWYCGAVGQFPCEPPDAACLAVFAADHGVVVEGISAYGSQVTADMVCNMMAGGAAINVLARHHRVKLALVDVGVAGDLSAAPVRPRVELTRASVRAGTRNLRREPAMTRSEVELAMNVGKRALDEFADTGARLMATGEVGIGNTTAGAALVCAMTGAAPLEVVGRGTGIDDAAYARKVEVVQGALRLHAPDPCDPIGVLAAVGGLELAATVGFLVRATERRVPVVLDGFLALASALVARALRPEVEHFMIASHDSAEQGSRLALDALGLVPLLSLQMRLGEGTGAVLGVELVRSAVALQSEMATFATAGVIRDATNRRNP